MAIASKSIYSRLLFMVGLLIFSVVVVISTVVFFTYKARLDANLASTAQLQSGSIEQGVKIWLSTFSSEVQGVSYAASGIEKDNTALLPLLKRIVASNSDISDIYWSGEIPYKDGGFFLDAGGWTPPADYDQTKRAWFSDTKKGMGFTVTKPYVDMITNKLVVSVATNVTSADGKAAGVVGIDLFMTKVDEMISKERLSAHGSSWLIDSAGLYFTNKDAAAVLKNSIFDMPALTAAKEKILSGTFTFGFSKDGSYYYSSRKIQGMDWVFVTMGPVSDVYGDLWAFIAQLVFAGVLCLAIAMVFSVALARSISNPLKAAVLFSERIAEGELDVDVRAEFSDRGDEIGSLAKAMQNMVTRIRGVIAEISQSAHQVAAGSQQLSSTSQQMSQGATEQAASVEEISSSMEEMTSNIKQNADNAMQTEKIAQKSALAAEEGGKAVAATVEAMKQIASKIGIIEEIARSTNMLALNASIEAARAGEYGKGFAVVASEVGKLAERSQHEAGEISKLSIESVGIAEQAGSTIGAMIPDIKRTAELVQEISAASNEQNSGAEQINSAILQLDQVVQQNASASEESASMSEELASQADQMQGTISFFKIGAVEAGVKRPAVQKKDSDHSPTARGSSAPVSEKKAESRSADTRAPVPSAVKKPEVRKETKPSASEPKSAENSARKSLSGITIVLDDDSAKSSRDAIDNDFQEF